MSNFLLDLLRGGLTKTGVGNDPASATYYDSPQQAVAAFGQQSKAPEQISNTYAPGLQFGEDNTIAQDPGTPQLPSFLQSRPENTPKFQKPSFLQVQNSPQLAQKAETKMGKLFQILGGAASGAASGAGSYSFGEGFARAQHADQQRKQFYNQQQQQLLQNQRQAQQDKNSQAEADRKAQEFPLNQQATQLQIEAAKKALAVKNQTPEEIQSERAKLVKDLGLTGDVAKMVMVTGKPPDDFGKRDDLTPYQKAQLEVENQRLKFEGQRVAIEGQKARNDANKKDVSQQAIETAAQSLASNNPDDLMRLRDIASMRGDTRLLIFKRAKELNPSFNPSTIDRKLKMIDETANGDTGKQLQSFGTFLEHAGEASDVVNQYRLSNSPLMNKSINWIRKNASADPGYQQYVTALEPVRKEFEGFLLGGRALYGDDRKAAETILSDDATPAQQQAALKQMGHTAKARYNEINHRYSRTVGSGIPDAFSPEATAGAKKIGVDLGASTPSSGGSEIHYKIVNGQLVAQ